MKSVYFRRRPRSRIKRPVLPQGPLRPLRSGPFNRRPRLWRKLPLEHCSLCAARRRRVIRRRHQPRKGVRLLRALHLQGGLRQSNPPNPALQNPPERVPASNSGSLMFDEPPLIVRMLGSAGFMEHGPMGNSLQDRAVFSVVCKSFQ